jgi:ribonucleoside-diphosphate reductase alpha chain
MALMTGAGIGVVYSNIRPRGSIIKKTGGVASGPCALMQMINECGRGIRQGGDRRSAIWAGLHWNHPDVFEFIHLKDWSPEVRALKEKDYNAPAPMDGTNISVILDDAFFAAYTDQANPDHALAVKVYWEVVRQMLSSAEPGFSVDVGVNAGEHGRNACTEITTRDDSDICNIGSINMANVESLEEMQELVEIATAFLLAGTVYSSVPYEKVKAIREKNRRLGLGLMGLHEWLLKRGKRYAPDPELARFLEVYMMSDVYAREYAPLWELSTPIKTRAIAPNGTIGIVAETTTSGEPILCVAMKRRYLKGNTVHFQYIVDPTAQRLIEGGMDPSQIEDAYGLAEDVERRVAFQAWLQRYVDHGISSTINLPAWGSPTNNQYRVHDFGTMLMKYLPHLRGVTCYPDGCRSGQPLEKVPYEVAVQNLGKVFVEGTVEVDLGAPVKMIDPALFMSDEQAAAPVDVCDLTKGGSCGA